MTNEELLGLIKEHKLEELMVKGRVTSANAQYSIIKQTSDGRLTQSWATNRRDGCFGSMSNNSTGSRYIILHLQEKRPELTEEMELSYLDYLFNRSPLKDMYITKDPKWALETGNVFVDADVPGNMMMQAMISVRHLWEANYKVWTWHHLCEAGVNEDLAYLIGHGIVYTTVADQAQFMTDNNHSGFYISRISYPFVKRWLSRDMAYARPDTYFRTGMYTGVADAFQSFQEQYEKGQTYGPYSARLQGWYEKVICDNYTGTKSNYISPFKLLLDKLKKQVKCYDIKRVAKIIAAHQNGLFKEIGYEA